MKAIKLIIFLITLVFLYSFTEKDNDALLLKIERSKDANVVYYSVNTDDLNHLKTNKPIKIYWIKHSRKGRIEPLTWIQRKYAYGLKYSYKCSEYAMFQFVSYDKLDFTLKKIEDRYKIYTLLNDKLVEVYRVFVQIDGGTFWIPNVSEVKIFAREVKSGKEVIEVIKP
jgi:hypothetical protein